MTRFGFKVSKIHKEHFTNSKFRKTSRSATRTTILKSYLSLGDQNLQITSQKLLTKVKKNAIHLDMSLGNQNL